MLTVNEKRALEYVISYTEAVGVAPSFRELRTHMKYASTSTPYNIFKALVRKGYLAKADFGRWRQIAILKTPEGTVYARRPANGVRVVVTDMVPAGEVWVRDPEIFNPTRNPHANRNRSRHSVGA